MTVPDDPGGGTLQKKVGGLPQWAWLAIAAAGAVVVMVWRQSSSKTTDQSTGSVVPTSAEDTGLSTSQYETLLTMLRDIQGQPSTPVTNTTTQTTDTTTNTSNTTPPVWTPESSGHSQIQSGNRGNLVKEWQTALKNSGFNPGPLDGIFGPKTLAATKAWQKARGLTANGVVTLQAWQIMHDRG